MPAVLPYDEALAAFFEVIDAAPLELPSVPRVPLWEMMARRALSEALPGGKLRAACLRSLVPALAWMRGGTHPTRDRACRDAILETALIALRLGDALSVLGVARAPWTDVERAALIAGITQAWTEVHPAPYQAAATLATELGAPQELVAAIAACLRGPEELLPFWYGDLALAADQLVQGADLVAESFIDRLSRGQAQLAGYELRDTRPFIGRLVQQPLLDAILSSASEGRQPLLLRARGALLLERVEAPPWPSREALADVAIGAVITEARAALQARPQGVISAGKLFKAADYLTTLLPNPRAVVEVALRALVGRVSPKTPPKRFAKVDEKLRRRGAPPPEWEELRRFNVESAIVGTIAEMLGLANILAKRYGVSLPVTRIVLEHYGLTAYTPLIGVLPTGVETGGTPYQAYVLAALIVRDRPGLDDAAWAAEYAWLAGRFAAEFPGEAEDTLLDPGTLFGDLRGYLADMLVLPGDVVEARQVAQDALAAYYQSHVARAQVTTCAMCGGHYGCVAQLQADSLTKPTGFTPRLLQFSSRLARPICAVCRSEQLLRRLFSFAVNEVGFSGKNAEDRSVTYLSITAPEGLPLELARALTTLQANLIAVDPRALQRWFTLALDQGEPIDQHAIEALPVLLGQIDEHEDRMQRDRGVTTIGAHLQLGLPAYPETEGASSRDGRLVQPLLVALILALTTDLPVTLASAGEQLPNLPHGGRLHVVSVPDGIRSILGGDTLSREELLPAFQRLLAVLAVHFDAVVSPDQWESLLGRFGVLARRLAAGPGELWALFRAASRAGRPINGARVRRYVAIASVLYEEDAMSYARRLVELQRAFYQSRESSNNALLRPLLKAGETLQAVQHDPAHTLTDPAASGTFDDPVFEAIRGALMRDLARQKPWVLPLVQAGDAEGHAQAVKAFALAITRLYRSGYSSTPTALSAYLKTLYDTCYGLALDARFAANEPVAVGDLLADEAEGVVELEGEADE